MLDYPLFWQISYFDNQVTLLQRSFILALTAKIWYLSSDNLKNSLSDLVVRELNSFKAVHFQEMQTAKPFFHVKYLYLFI